MDANLGVHLAVKRLIECSEIIMRGTNALDSAVELGIIRRLFNLFILFYFLTIVTGQYKQSHPAPGSVEPLPASETSTSSPTASVAHLNLQLSE